MVINRNYWFQQQAAATTVYTAVAGELDNVTGLYFNNCFYCAPSELSRDEDLAWEVFTLSLRIIEERMGQDSVKKYMDKCKSRLTCAK